MATFILTNQILELHIHFMFALILIIQRQIQILQVNYFQSQFVRMYSRTPSSKTTGATTACKTTTNLSESPKVFKDKTCCALSGEPKVNSARWLAFTTKWSTLSAATRTSSWIEPRRVIQIQIQTTTQIKTSFNLNGCQGLQGMHLLTQLFQTWSEMQPRWSSKVVRLCPARPSMWLHLSKLALPARTSSWQ